MRLSKSGRTSIVENAAAVSESMKEQYSGEVWERIARQAYELYEQRGRQDGRALEDWLEAEEIVMRERHEGRS